MSGHARFITALGVGSLGLAGLLQLLKFQSHAGGGFLAYAFDSEFDYVSIFFVVLGVLILVRAFFIHRSDKALLKFDEDLRRASESGSDRK